MNNIMYRSGQENAVHMHLGDGGEIDSVSVIIVPDGQEDETIRKAHAELRRRGIVAEEPEDDLESIREELANNKPVFNLLKLSKELSETYTPEELSEMENKATSLMETEGVSPELIGVFWTATISRSMELSEKGRPVI